MKRAIRLLMKPPPRPAPGPIAIAPPETSTMAICAATSGRISTGAFASTPAPPEVDAEIEASGPPHARH